MGGHLCLSSLFGGWPSIFFITGKILLYKVFNNKTINLLGAKKAALVSYGVYYGRY